MTRMEEFQELLVELKEPVSELEGTLKRAKRRRARKQRTVGAFAGVAAVFILFVGLVNFSAPVAYACSQIPIIKELAEAVTFSRSLSDAVENEYVQPMNLYAKDGDVTASVEYVIVDQKQLNIFYRMDSDKYTALASTPKLLAADGSQLYGYGLMSEEWGLENGDLRCITADFMDGDVPETLIFKMDIHDNGSFIKEEALGMAPESTVEDIFEEELEAPDYIAHFEFLLEFDPLFTAQGKIYEVNQTLKLDEQQITFTEMEVYPTHLRVNVEESLENSAWLTSLKFYIETDWGMKFDTISNGISATGTEDTPSMVSYRADSSYFYDAKHFKIVITGAEFLDKDMGKAYINLTSEEAVNLPEGVRLVGARKNMGSWVVTFEADYRKPNSMHQLFKHQFYDKEGNAYDINAWTSTFGEENEDGEILTFMEEFPLKNYPYDEVWLEPKYSHTWTAIEPLKIKVQ